MTAEARRSTPPTPSQPPARPPTQPRRPPNKPDSPPIERPSKGALLAMDDALASLEHVASRRLPDPGDRVEACGQAILAFRLKRARAAVADLLAYQHPAGRPPLPGGGFTLPRPPDFKIGVR